MSDFKLNYKQEVDYYNKVELNIELRVKPSKVDMDAVLDALETIEDFANKYLKQVTPPITKDTK